MGLWPFDAALACLLRSAGDVQLGVEEVALAEAHGRVLAGPVFATRDVPGFANAAMDGYAARSGGALLSAGSRYRVVGRALAGDGLATVESGDALIETATGAMIPSGADTVLPYELTRRDGEFVELLQTLRPGAHVRAADDDFSVGVPLAVRGQRLRFAELAALASMGLDRVAVMRRLRIAVIATGNELAAIGSELAPGQVYESNSLMLTTMLRQVGCEVRRIGPIRDRRDDIAAALLAALDTDLVLTIGGASAGRADHLPALLHELGEVRFWKIAMRPGMPVIHAWIGQTPIVALPGNPVSVVASSHSLLLPMIAAMQGQAKPDQEYARLAEPVQKNHNRLEWRRGFRWIDGHGIAWIRPNPRLSSGALRSVVESNALLRIDADQRRLGTGKVVAVIGLLS